MQFVITDGVTNCLQTCKETNVVVVDFFEEIKRFTRPTSVVLHRSVKQLYFPIEVEKVGRDGEWLYFDALTIKKEITPKLIHLKEIIECFRLPDCKNVPISLAGLVDLGYHKRIDFNTIIFPRFNNVLHTYSNIHIQKAIKKVFHDVDINIVIDGFKAKDDF